MAHRVAEAQDAVWNACWDAYVPVWLKLYEQYGSLERIPDPACVSVPQTTPVCISGHRSAAQGYYVVALSLPAGKCTLEDFGVGG